MSTPRTTTLEIIAAFGASEAEFQARLGQGKLAISKVTGASPHQIYQWYRIGVPHKHHLALLAHAKEIGVTLTPEMLLSTKPCVKGQVVNSKRSTRFHADQNASPVKKSRTVRNELPTR